MSKKLTVGEKRYLCDRLEDIANVKTKEVCADFPNLRIPTYWHRGESVSNASVMSIAPKDVNDVNLSITPVMILGGLEDGILSLKNKANIRVELGILLNSKIAKKTDRPDFLGVSILRAICVDGDVDIYIEQLKQKRFDELSSRAKRLSAVTAKLKELKDNVMLEDSILAETIAEFEDMEF